MSMTEHVRYVKRVVDRGADRSRRPILAPARQPCRDSPGGAPGLARRPADTVNTDRPCAGGAPVTNHALLVVDMQNGFCHPDGSFSQIDMGLEGAQDAVRNAAVAVAQARRAAIPVVFTRHVYRPGRADEGAALIRNSPALAGINGLAAGFWDADVVDELGCGPEDLVVDKVRFDAFQWTSLEPLLRGLGVSELIVCGVVTNLCVETTVRSAFMRDYP